MIPRFRPALGVGEIGAALQRSRPDDIDRFERDFADALGQTHAVAFPYGRTALLVLLEALGIRDREVICPAYTCVVVPHAIVLSGNRPVFVDCAPDDFNMDLQAAEAAITSRTGAIIATSLFGYPVDLDALDGIRARHPAVSMIQDCAHSFGAEWNGRSVNVAGVAAIYGLNISKLATSIFGGMITTDDARLAAEIRRVRAARVTAPSRVKSVGRLAYLLATEVAFHPIVYGLVNRLEQLGALSRFVQYYEPDVIDMPSDYLVGMTRLEARVGRRNVRRLAAVITERRRAAELYDQLLGEIPGIRRPPVVKGATYSHYVVLTDEVFRLVELGRRTGIQFGRLVDYCVPLMPAYRGMSPGQFPIAANLARTVLNLPVYDSQHVQDIVDVLRTLKRF